MLNAIKKLRQKMKPTLAPIPTTASKTLVDALESGHCPDCGSNEFYHGPEGGVCINITCAKCAHQFNIAVVNGSIFHAERI